MLFGGRAGVLGILGTLFIIGIVVAGLRLGMFMTLLLLLGVITGGITVTTPLPLSLGLFSDKRRFYRALLLLLLLLFIIIISGFPVF